MNKYGARYLLLLVMGLVLDACAIYQPLPLDDNPVLPKAVVQLKVDARSLPFPHFRKYRVNPADGLNMTEVAILAVLNNPGLKLYRADVHIAHAQAFSAGLLPDPQFNLSRDYPAHSGPGITDAYSNGIAYDVNKLISHDAKTDAAVEDLRKASLNLLWQEWQVITRARVLFTKVYTQNRLSVWLRENRDLLAQQYRKSEAALAQGNISVDSADAALVAWQDAERRLNNLQRNLAGNRHKLDGLLGLAPDVVLNLAQGGELQTLPDDFVHQALQNLSQRRPDLLALKAGYAAQDARYRQEILNQFPALSVGLNRARDTSALQTRGFSIGLTLPFLDGNRGNVAIAKATRQRLRDEYEIRLNAARADILRLLSDRDLIQSQLDSLRAHLPQLDMAAKHARLALARGAINTAGYVSFESVRISKHIEAARLRQDLQDNQITLLALVGGDFPIQYNGNSK